MTPTPEEIADYCCNVIRETVDRNRWIPVTPTVPQAVFLSRWEQEAMYGGAAGGGKSIALLAAALQYVDTPGYRALLLRRTFPDLSQAGGLMDLAHQWLHGTGAVWNEQRKLWTFPTGATLAFGYLDNDTDKYRYQGGQYQMVGFDELTQFEEPMYAYLFSRLRKPLGLPVPLRMRSASNPGGIGHEWVRRRFVSDEARQVRDRTFIPAKLDDNPHLDRSAYLDALDRLDPVTRAQLRDGDWSVVRTGGVFDIQSLQWQERHIRPGTSGRLMEAA